MQVPVNQRLRMVHKIKFKLCSFQPKCIVLVNFYFHELFHAIQNNILSAEIAKGFRVHQLLRNLA